MKNILEQNITYLDGLESIKLYSNYDDVIKFLKDNNISYNYEFWPNTGCTPEIPWKVLRIQNSISLFFAKDKLWKILLENDYKGSLNNGLKLGMNMEDALKADSSLKYDDWEEVYTSDNYYDIEDNLDDNTILSISVYIKELLDEETFYKYEW